MKDEGDNMCGRFTISVSYEELVEYLDEEYQIKDIPLFDLPRYNVAPGQEVISILHDGTKYRVGNLKWGFIPSYAKDENIGFSMINAKSETIFEKRSFIESVKSKRCVVLADSFYEWKKENNQKIPMRILVKDKKIFPIAAIYNTYQTKEGKKIHTVSLLTTEANELMKTIHERMPVILNQKSLSTWLNIAYKDSNVLSDCFKSYPSEFMEMYQVSKDVNKASIDEPYLIQKI